MNKLPIVSIIIPSYERPVLILRAIESILSQSFKDIEVVVVDDSRTDAVRIAVSKVADPRVRYFHNEEQLGFAENKNQGVKMSRAGKYIAFCDDDDEFLDGFIERTVMFLDSHSDVYAVTTGAYFRTQGGVDMGVYPGLKPGEVPMWAVTIGNGWIMKRDIFQEDNIWFDRNILFEDLDFGISVAQKHKVEYLPDILRIYYGYPVARGKSVSTSTHLASTEKITGFISKHEMFYRKSGNEALSWVYLMTGKRLCQADRIKEGRVYLKKAYGYRHTFKTFFYCLLAWVAPGAFKDLRFIVNKNRIRKIFQ